jgi:3D (Asp-Asp-Asp) domain-containing protein
MIITLLMTIGLIAAPTEAIAPEVERPYEIIQGEVTAYSSTPDQTDDTPFITANGDTVGQGTVACPGWLEFGTDIEILGVKYKCNDRMAERYRWGNYFDIWVVHRAEAYEFGRRDLEIKIYKDL